MDPLALQWLPFGGLIAFAVTGALVGTRLLRLARRTRERAAFLLGGALLLAGAVGPAGITIAAVLGPARPGVVPYAWGLGLAAINLAASLLYAFNWSVFHGSSRRAVAVGAIAIALTWTTFAISAATSGLDRIGLLDPFAFASLAGRLLAFVWAGVVSLDQWSKARRRAELGLVEPAVVRRLGLWGLGASAAATLFTLNLVRGLLGDSDPSSPIALTLVPALGLIASASILLAFFEAPWRRRRRAAAA